VKAIVHSRYGAPDVLELNDAAARERAFAGLADSLGE
jgi:hypothetical protein